MTDEAKGVLSRIDALAGRLHEHNRIMAARAAATEEGRDPDLAAREAEREPRPPAKLLGHAPGVSGGRQDPIFRRRVERIRAAMNEGRLTPAEGRNVLAAMAADENAACKLLDELPQGRVPLEPRAEVPLTDGEGGLVAWTPPGGALPDGLSLLSRSERAEAQERRHA